MKKSVLFERVDLYVDYILDQIQLECSYDPFVEDEITNRTKIAKDTADLVSDMIGGEQSKDLDHETVYTMPTRAPIAAEI